MKNSTVFAKAAKIVMERGLNKGGYGKEGGPRCIIGAVYESSSWVQGPRAVMGLYADVYEGDWNDDPDTTADEVVQLLQFMALSEKDAGR